MSDIDSQVEESRPDDGVDDLIEQAMQDDSVAVDAGAAEDRPGYTRDESGRFAPKDDAAATVAAEGEGQPQNPSMTPATVKDFQELLNANEARQRVERERDALAARLAQHERKAEPAPAVDPDLVFTDPVAFAANIQAEARREVAQMRLDTQFAVAEIQHGCDVVNAARQALTDSGDEALANQLMAKSNPVQALISWHKREKTLSAIPDGDLTAYDARRQDELLKDPAFLARALEAAQAAAGGNAAPGLRQPANVVRIPQRVSNVGTAAALQRGDDNQSDHDLYASIVGSR